MWSKYALKIYDANLKKFASHQVRAFNNLNGIYQVITSHTIHSFGGGHHSHEINILARTCSYGKQLNRKTTKFRLIFKTYLLGCKGTLKLIEV